MNLHTTPTAAVASSVGEDPPRLVLDGYSAGFVGSDGPFAVVEDIDLVLRQGEITALVGESGSGKTVTCLSLMGLNGAWQRGRAQLGDIDLVGLGESALNRLRGSKMAMVQQQPTASLDPVMSVGRHLTSVLHRSRGLAGDSARREAVRLLEEVQLPDARVRLGSFPHELSGGMNQRVALALALAGEPDVIFADEPTTSLDNTVRRHILGLLRRIVDSRRISVLLVTHDIDVAGQVADRIATLYAGCLVERGPVREVLSEPHHPYMAALLQARPTSAGRSASLRPIPGVVPEPQSRPAGCPFVPRCTRASELCETRPRIVAEGVRASACWHPVRTLPADADAKRRTDGLPAGGSALVHAEGVSKRFTSGRWLLAGRRSNVAVDNVSFSLTEGRSLGLVGESGCGKSTLARMIAGLIAPSSGSLRVADGIVDDRLNLRTHGRRVQMVFQNARASLDPRLPVDVQVADPLIVHGLAKPRPALDIARSLLDELKLPQGAMGARPATLSGGQQQRVVIARALILQPPLLVCDEPTSALDLSIQAEVINLINDLRARRRLTLIFISHDMAAIGAIADDILVMLGGRIVEAGRGAEVLEAPAHPFTRALVAAATPRREHLDQHHADATLAAQGCSYSSRCPLARPVCRETAPQLAAAGDGRRVACHAVHGP